MITKEKYGICDGEQIYKYTLESENLTAEILNYGAIIKSLKFNDVEVAIGLNSLDEYRTKFGSFGAIVGRCANRIKGGKINLSGVEYQLTQNEYVKAYEQLIYDVDNTMVKNPTCIDIFVRYDGKEVVIPAGQTVKIK